MNLLFNVVLCIQYNKLSEDEKIIADYFIVVAVVLALLFFAGRIFNFFEMAYVEYINKRLFFNHIYFRKRKLSKDQKSILNRNFKFYRRLPLKQKAYFEHRVSQFVRKTEFIGKDIKITEEMKMLIAATLIKLTFGLRDYNIKSVERIILYPEEFYSQTNKAYHKGEFNLGLKALVFSWKDVLYGYAIEDDNINLAIHEFTHAIHFYYMSARRHSTSAAIFLDAYVELSNMLDANAELKSKLIASKFLRDYAFTNQFEFLSVIIETFIESPEPFKNQFPGIYGKVKTMLGFNFTGY
ncbi:zinc-dependent peptidase [Psychroserpens sp. SPM9]|uniref:zinc-dependent peptidase n=1 Tax=Psychroserpens sp. SPM9 TaxID=2975598 RepID=UPI0021A34417|nr:zinc-dependent peptidase [Psychroserpens sp. SPM9]MDG5490158.1 zinc-dependent peptidase [Psychroserpens sp. SPM9]